MPGTPSISNGSLEAVPVHGGRLRQMVLEDHADMVALIRLDRRPRRAAIEAPDIDGLQRADPLFDHIGDQVNSAIALGQAQPPAKPEPAPIRPFKMHVPDRVLIDLRHRLAEANWPDQLPGTTWEYGADIKKVRELADYWQNSYDWRAQEAKINQFDQFTTEIDGQQIYFIHQRSPRPDAIPLMLIHGWPGSILEFEKLIGPLTHPKNKNSPAFDVIIPSLPGFGYSGPTTTRGWGPQRMAKALVVLMDRLGYSKYGIQGGDWGSAIAQDMAYQAPTHVSGCI